MMSDSGLMGGGGYYYLLLLFMTFDKTNLHVRVPGPSHFVPLKDDSFDVVPRKASPGYAHVEVVRKRVERNRLDGHVCHQCDKVRSFLMVTFSLLFIAND